MKRIWMLAAVAALMTGVACTNKNVETADMGADPLLADITGVQKESATTTEDLDEMYLTGGVQETEASAAMAPVAMKVSVSALASQVRDVYFDFDQAVIRAQDKPILLANAEVLKQNPDVTASLEGHADNRGTTAYNLALGERRAMATRRYLVALGVSPAQVQTVSYGEERPTCMADNESCWTRNRRAHMTLSR